LDDGDIRPQHNWFSPDKLACQRGLHFVPRQQQLQLDDRAERLREFGMPFDDLATDE
jgi:hypothetical protein